MSLLAEGFKLTAGGLCDEDMLACQIALASPKGSWIVFAICAGRWKGNPDDVR